jgi:hypothetical protein
MALSWLSCCPWLLQLKPPGLGKLVGRVLDCEGDAEHWSLKDRFVLANDMLDGYAAAGEVATDAWCFALACWGEHSFGIGCREGKCCCTVRKWTCGSHHVQPTNGPALAYMPPHVLSACLKCGNIIHDIST